MRMLLEPVAAELAASRASQRDLEDLASLGRQTYPSSDPAGYERFLADNCEFHARVAEAAGNSLLARALRTLLEEMQRLFFISLGPAATEQLHEHHELYDALLARDPARARAIVEAQIESSRQRVLQALMDGAAAQLRADLRGRAAPLGLPPDDLWYRRRHGLALAYRRGV